MTQIRFDAKDMTFIASCEIGSSPAILYWGAALPNGGNATMMHKYSTLLHRNAVKGSADIDIAPTLAMESGNGFSSLSGFEAHRAGRDWASRFIVQNVSQDIDKAYILCRDEMTKITLIYEISCDENSGIITISSSITNDSNDPLTLNKMASACIPLPDHMTEITGFSGKWAQEFEREQISLFHGNYVRENRKGRTSHDSYPALLVGSRHCNETSGEVYGFHLAWSGNHKIELSQGSDGRSIVSMGALILAGEVILTAGETYQSPAIICAYSSSGYSALSQKFHHHVRIKIIRPKTRNKPRPVHYNSWEAVYFNHDMDQLKSIANKAAEIGVERFVLDDGWFGSRRNDRSGLGDWYISDDVYPDGLGPLIDHITGLGMEMGLWFEPEMVNPDSDLYRSHPDWVLQIEGRDQIPSRHQYVLNIANSEVADYLFHAIDTLLKSYDISYIKWDMNRDIHHPQNGAGYPYAIAQIWALYNVLDRIRKAHPHVEIETCSSGGGRADMGILAHSDRIWTSDSNDALDRQNIQKGASFFLPLDVLGAHVGPAQCHITGRTLSMAMRAGTAIMGHMGAELNLLYENSADIALLAKAITIYKKHRDLLHHGDFVRLDSADYINAIGAIDKDNAIFSAAFLRGYNNLYPAILRFAGLDQNSEYSIKRIWPEYSPTNEQKVDHQYMREKEIYTGSMLMNVGLQLPPALPETLYIFHLVRL